jgi:hypothetical protein
MVRTSGSRPAMPSDPTKEEFFAAVDLVNRHRGNYTKMIKFLLAGMNEKFRSKAYTEIGFLGWFEPQSRLEPGRDKASTVFLIKGGDSLQQGTLSETMFDAINKCRGKFGLDDLSPTWLRLSAGKGTPPEAPRIGYTIAQPTRKSTVRVMVSPRRPKADHNSDHESEEFYSLNESVPQDRNADAELIPIHFKILQNKRQRVSTTGRLSNGSSLSTPNTRQRSFQTTPQDSTNLLHDRIAHLERTLQDSRSQVATLQSQLRDCTQTLEDESNRVRTFNSTASQISSLQNLLHVSNTALYHERDRTRSFELALVKQHGETFGNEFADLLGRDRAASRNRDKIATLFGTFDDREFPQTPSANSIRSTWEQVSNELKRNFITTDTLCPRFSSADFPRQMWSGLEMLFETKGQLEKEELKHTFDTCVALIRPRCLARCLVGFVLIRLVFGSSFPKFIGGDMREREKLYTLIAMRGKMFCTERRNMSSCLLDGPTAVHRANYAASKLLVSEPSFTDTTIPEQARHWTDQLCTTLEPCFRNATNVPSASKNSRRIQGTDAAHGNDATTQCTRTHIQSAISTAISLKITLELTPLSVRYVLQYFTAGSPVSSKYMTAENEKGSPINSTHISHKDFKIRLCLSPALLQVPVQVPTLEAGPEAISSLIVFSNKFSITACEEDMEGVIVVSKAVVLVDIAENEE